MSDDTPRVPSAWQLERAVSAFQQLEAIYAADPNLADDEEGIRRELADAEITHPDVLLQRAIDAAVWAAMREIEADNLRREVIARRDRYRARLANIRDIIEQLLTALEVTSARAKYGAASLRMGPPSVVLLDADLIPDDLCKITREPIKTDIRERIEAGEDVPGAAMSNPAPVLQIRRL